MLPRRGKPFGPTVLFVVLLLLAGYGFYLYNEQYSKFIESEGKLALTKKRQLSLKSQLHVVYEHRTKLEAALIKEKKNHRVTRKEYISKMKESQANLTKARYEAMNRFNALDTEHKMLKAKHEEITTDYSNLQQQYVRLSEDHQKIVNGQKEDFERLKDTKDKESRSLQERVKALYNEKEEQKAEASKYFGYYRSERNERVKLTNSISELNTKISDLEDKTSLCESERGQIKRKFAAAEKEITELEKKVSDLEHQATQRSAVAHQEKAEVDLRQPTEPPKVTTGLQSNVDAPPSSSNSRVDSRSREEGKPSRRTAQATTVALEKENVKSKILGKGGQHLDKDSKPSDRVQRLLIGKTIDAKQEDSLMDEYNTGELSKDDKKQGTETRYVGRPTIRAKDHVRETRFRDLVVSPTPDGGDVGNVKKHHTQGLAVGGKASENSEAKKQLKNDNSQVIKNKEDMDGRSEKFDDTSPSKERVSQYSKAKADATEKKAEEVSDNEKEADAGEAFLKKQQQLMHRGADRGDDAKIVESESESDEKVASEKKLEKESDVLDVEKEAGNEQKLDETRISAEKSNIRAVQEGLPAMVSDDKTDGWAMVKERETEMRQSKQEGKEERVRIGSDKEPRKIERGRQLQAPDSRKRKSHAEAVNEETEKAKEEKLEGPDKDEDIEKHFRRHRNQLHAPIKKPKELVRGIQKSTNEDAKEDDGNAEDDAGEQEVDKSKKSDKDESDKVDTEDESRTGFK